jgi:RND family efflux transporter MFP subunit
MPTFTLARALLLATLVALAGCGESAQKQAAAPPPPTVTVAKPIKRTVIDQDEYVGRFVPVDSVEIRARVSGYLDSIHFTDGQMIKQGDLLFTIDRRPFQSALDQAVANLEQARANLSFAETDLARGAQLVKERTITEQSFDQRTQVKRVAEATVAARDAAVKSATLDLEFTELRAPVAGRIGDRRVSPGNLVTGSTTGNTSLLATIVSMDPMRFEFTFDEASYLRYERLAKGGRDMTSRDTSMVVALKLLDEADFTHQGRMDFVDNAIDRSSGTIRGRAVFSNPDSVFTPGMFGRVRVPGSPSYVALLVPDIAVGTEQTRKYLLTVGADNVVQLKYVTLGQLFDNKLRVIKSGVQEDDRVVVNGLMRARPNQKVTPQDEAVPTASSGTPQAKAE